MLPSKRSDWSVLSPEPGCVEHTLHEVLSCPIMHVLHISFDEGLLVCETASPNRYSMLLRWTQHCRSPGLFYLLRSLLKDVGPQRAALQSAPRNAITLQGRYWACRQGLGAGDGFVCVWKTRGGGRELFCFTTPHPPHPPQLQISKQTLTVGVSGITGPLFHTGDKAWSSESASY